MVTNESLTTRSPVLKRFGAAASLNTAALAQQRGIRSRPQVEGVLTPSPTAIPGGKPLLTLYFISLQWANCDEAADTTAKTIRPGTGMVDFKNACEFMKAIGLVGSSPTTASIS